MSEEPACTTDRPADAYILSRLRHESPECIPIIENRQLNDVVGILERFGIVANGLWSASKPRLDRNSAAKARDAGLVLLRGWPSSFFNALDSILANANSMGSRPGLIGSYGWIYESWVAPSSDQSNPFAIALCSALREHAVGNGVMSPSESFLTKERSLSTITITKAASVLKMGYARTRRLLGEHGMIPTAARRSVPIPISSREFALLKAAEARRVSVSTAASLLRIGKKQMYRILAAGLIQCCDDNTKRPRALELSTVAIEEFRQLVCAMAPIRKLKPSGSSRLPAACKSAGVPIEHVCLAIMKGEIKTVGLLESRASLRDVLVRTADVRGLRYSQIYTLQETARILSIHPEAARWLVRAGVLAGCRRGRHQGVTSSAIEAFRHSYISGKELANRHKMSSRSLRKRLDSLGVMPVAEPPECRQLFYRRSAKECGVLTARRSNVGVRSRSRKPAVVLGKLIA